MLGKLYLVATPIGNLEDITLRAIRILNDVDYIAAEDTRHTLKLLNHLNISKPLISYYKEVEHVKSSKIIEKLINGKNIALVSDAGTPAISDPGEIIVKEALKENIEVISIPGPCALISALICSGINSKEFTFIGFLPAQKNLKSDKLNSIKDFKETLIFYEAPHKLINTLQEMQKILGNRNIVLARELTKIHEEYIRGTISEILSNLDNPKGEFVIIVEGSNSNTSSEKDFLNSKTVDEHFLYYKNLGYEKKEIIKLISKDRGVAKNEIYQYFINKNT